MKRIFLRTFTSGILFIVLGITNLAAQELPYTQNLSWEHERHSWIASWISPSKESLNDYGVFLFRNSVTLTTVPDISKIYVSADNRYRLYVNGKYVNPGPCDSINTALHPWGWKEKGFNTKDWKFPTAVQKGVGRGYMHGTPWMLVPREIPLLEERIERIPRIARVSGIKIDKDYIFGNVPLLIPEHSKVSIL